MDMGVKNTMDRVVRYTIERGFYIPWVGGPQKPGLGVQNTMDRGFDIPGKGSIYHGYGGQNTMGRGRQNTMDKGFAI